MARVREGIGLDSDFVIGIANFGIVNGMEPNSDICLCLFVICLFTNDEIWTD